jgi:putative addiction module component (TIGR02574 family)
MTVAQKKNQLAQKLLQTEDKHILKAIESILDPKEDYIELSPAQKKDLDKRLADHKAGKLKNYTIEEVRKEVLKALKK